MTIKVVWRSADGNFSGGTAMKLSDAQSRYQQAVTQLQASPTAVAILKCVTEHKTEIQLVCAPGAEGEMLFPGELEGLNVPTVIWDPNKYFHFYVNVAPVSNVIFGDLKSYQPAIVLLHEIGHAKQWLENAAQHERRYHRGPEGVAEIEAENLALHEGPVAKELGLPVRRHYQHFPNSTMMPNNQVRLLHQPTYNADGSVTTGARNALN